MSCIRNNQLQINLSFCSKDWSSQTWMKNVGSVGFHNNCLRSTAEEHKSHDRVYHC